VANIKQIRAYAVVCSLVVVLQPLPGLTQQNADASKAVSQAEEQDEQRDFDPLLGKWKYHLKRRVHPLTGSNTWVEFDGTAECFRVWDGHAELDTIEQDTPTDGYVEGLTLRTCNSQSHQWTLYWANSRNDITDAPQIGEFRNRRGEFYARRMFNGKNILIRFVWTNMTTDMSHFEQSFSDDGGKTWEVNWITDQTRVKDETDKAH
jgi:hypothetical protein